MKTYRVIAEPDDGGWLIYAPDIRGAHSQGRNLDRARANIREAIGLVLDVPEDSFEIDLDYSFPEDIKKSLYDLNHVRQQLADLEELRSRLTEEAVQHLNDFRLSLRDEAALLGLSFQRVQQLKAPASRPKTTVTETVKPRKKK